MPYLLCNPFSDYNIQFFKKITFTQAFPYIARASLKHSVSLEKKVEKLMSSSGKMMYLRN